MSQIQPTSDRTLMDEAIALTAAQPSQIQTFLDHHNIDLAEFLQSDDLIEALAQEAIAPPRPEIPVEALHTARSQIDAQLEKMATQIDQHLSQWEDAKAKQLTARFGAVPANVTRKMSEQLGGLSADADGFLSQLAAAFPLDSAIERP